MKKLLFNLLLATIPLIAFAGRYSHSEHFDFVDLGENSALKIYTPGTCHFLNSVNVAPGSKIIVYCNSATGTHDIRSEIMDGRIEIHAYDKYGISNTTALQKPYLLEEPHPYYPLLEDGKEWTYRLIRYVAHPDFHASKPAEFELVYKIDGTVVDGEETFYKVSVFVDGECYDREEVPILLKENPEEKKVEIGGYGLVEVPHLFHPWNTEPMMLYDFSNPMDSEILVEENFDYEGPFEMELCDGIHNSHILNSKVLGMHALVEGVGMVGLDDEKWTMESYDLLGECSRVGMEWLLPHLYKVTGGDGRLIYLNPEYEKGCTSTPKLNVDTYIVQQEGAIVVSGSDASVASLYNMQGQCVATQPILNGNATISTEHLPTGIYFISAGTLTEKIFVKP